MSTTTPATKPQPNDDYDVWVLHKHRLVTITGEEHECPKCSWRMERQVLRCIAGVIEPLVSSNVFAVTTESGGANDQVIRILEILLQQAPDKVTEAAAVLTGTDVQWVDENLNIEGIIDLLVPFFASKRKAILERLGPMLERMATRINVAAQQMAS